MRSRARGWRALVSLMLVLGAGSAFEAVSAVAAKVHSRALVPCSLLKTSEVSAAVHYAVKAVTAPTMPTAIAGGVTAKCTFTELHPTKASGGPRTVTIIVQQRNFGERSSSWTASAAARTFAQLRSFLAYSPLATVHGLGDTAMWSPELGVLYVLSGDLVLGIRGQDGPDVFTSESVDIALMRKMLART